MRQYLDQKAFLCFFVKFKLLHVPYPQENQSDLTHKITSRFICVQLCTHNLRAYTLCVQKKTASTDECVQQYLLVS